jgi:di/tricarboxylate transporter
MLPIILTISRESGISPSKLLIPMAFAASLGTAIAIIGAPAFLVANGLLRQAGQSPLGIFSIAPIGLVLSLTGALFFLFAGKFLLPDRQGTDESVDHFRLEGYYTELVLLPDSPLLGKTIQEVEEEQPVEFKVSAWYRNGRPRNKPYGTKKTQAGDVLVIRTTPDKLATIEQERGIALQPLEKYKETVSSNGESEKSKEELASRLVQSVVAPRSELIGKTIGRIDFIENYGVIVVGVWRRKGWLRTELSRVRLREGDVLVMTGDNDSIRRISEDRSFLMLMPFRGEPKPLHKARLAGIIMILSIVLAAINIVPVEIAFLTGALVMILSGCISAGQAYQSIDSRIYIFIAGAIPLGLAMQETGTANLLASWLQGVVSGWEIHWILLALFIVTGLLT